MRQGGTTIIYGRRPVLEALRGGRRVRRLWLAEHMTAAPILAEITSIARVEGVTIAPADRRELDQLTGGAHNQGVVAEAAERPGVTLEELLARATADGEVPLLLVADHLEDPQNLGSLIRSADAAGAHGLVLPTRRSAGVTPAVERASAGATEHVPVAPVVNLARTLRQLKDAGLWVIGLDAGAPQHYDQADLTIPLALVVGGEGRGLTRLVREGCDLLVRLPMVGQVQSLNAAVAGAIVLYEAVRQRQGSRTSARPAAPSGGVPR